MTLTMTSVVPAGTPEDLAGWLAATGASKNAIAFAKQSTDLAASWQTETDAQTLVDLIVELRPAGWLETLRRFNAAAVKALLVVPAGDYEEIFSEGVKLLDELAAGASCDTKTLKRLHNKMKQAARSSEIASGGAHGARYAAEQAGDTAALAKAERQMEITINRVWALNALTDALTENVVWAAGRVIDRVARGSWTATPFGVNLSPADLVRSHFANPFQP